MKGRSIFCVKICAPQQKIGIIPLLKLNDTNPEDQGSSCQETGGVELAVKDCAMAVQFQQISLTANTRAIVCIALHQKV